MLDNPAALPETRDARIPSRGHGRCAETHHRRWRRGEHSTIIREMIEAKWHAPARWAGGPLNEAIALFGLILAMRSAIKEECLTDDRLQTIYIKRFGYEKSRLWRRSGKESFWICSNEYHRYGDRFEDLIHGFESRASVRKLNIREYEARLLALNRFGRLAMGTRDIDDPVPLLLDERLKIKGNKRFVLDD